MSAEAPKAGCVHLVGAGPGDPRLLTAKALELIAAADVVIYDRLIPMRALDGAKPGAELLYVGKQGGGPSVPQAQTEALMIARARDGADVVRLKGGDPFVFGRGGEEALALRQAGVSFEVVPGVSAGIAAPAYAGIPVTHRGVAAAVAFVTGHRMDGGPAGEDESLSLDWRSLAAFPGTLVFYMGVGRLKEICEALIVAGRSSEEPAAVVERGTLPGQRVVRASLAGLSEKAAAAKVKAPSVTVVGAVSALAERLEWISCGPLAGLTVTVTRARAQASGFARRLEELGAEVIRAPAIRIRPLAGPPLDPSPYELICLTSPNGVHLLFERLALAGKDSRSLAGACVAAIGPGTAAALAQHGVIADVVPERFVAESLVESLAGVSARRALIARASSARDVLERALREQGMEVDVLALYETVAEPVSAETLDAALKADYMTFTSSSTVVRLMEAWHGNDARALGRGGAAAPLRSSMPKIVSIGPVTSRTLEEHGLSVDVEARRHDIDGLVEALVADASE